MSDSRLLTTREVAERLGYQRDTVSRNAHKIPGAKRVFGRWRFDPDALDAWINSQSERDPWARPTRGGVTS